MPVTLSVLDLAFVPKGGTAREAYAASVALAQAAERHGFERVWYAEHHSMPDIASSATSVLIEHVASRTERIRLGAGGIMLPNHSPLVIAEQFGTLATLHPGRIDLGLGRAPGGDQRTLRALRRTPESSDAFPQDVLELQAYLRGESRVPGVQSYPVPDTAVPLYVLGSSLFGAQLAGALGLPYAFASHFAPQALHRAIEVYREQFAPQPGGIREPYVIAGANIVAADAEDDARAMHQRILRDRVRRFATPASANHSDAEIDAFLDAPQGAQIRDMMRCTAVGTGERVRAWLEGFARETGAGELMVAFQADSAEARLRALEITAASGALARSEAPAA